MLFNSDSYFLFLPIVLLLFYFCPQRFRHILLLGASFSFFAAWSLPLSWLLVYVIAVSYTAGTVIENSKSVVLARTTLIFCTTLILGLLFYYKYKGFFSSILSSFSGWGLEAGWGSASLVLPLGISFYTFQALSYTFDVYLKKIPAEKSVVSFALYLSFFPQLVAGPIERAKRLLPQVKTLNGASYESLVIGQWLIIWGLFKKVVLADGVGDFVDAAYINPAAENGATLLLATYLYALQIYWDFSGYVDIARGSARMLGINLSPNFIDPYFSASVKEFWGRWHITLSHWFRDYVFYPLAFTTTVRIPLALAVIVVFGLSGLWHGANWTFVIWGLLHAGFILTQEVVHFEQWKIPRWLKVALTFHLVTFAWIFFRAGSVEDALLVIERIFTASYAEVRLELLSKSEILFTAATIVGYGLWIFVRDRMLEIEKIILKPKLLWGGALVVFYLVLFFGKMNEERFIYFQF